MDKAGGAEVAAQLHRFGMARDRMRTAMAGEVGLGLTDLDALEYLERFGPLTQRDLGARLLLTSGAVTQLVDRLERQGLVCRSPHPTDRRATLVELAPGAALPDLPDLAEYHQELHRAAEALTARERAAFVAFLQRLELRADGAATGISGRRAAPAPDQ